MNGEENPPQECYACLVGVATGPGSHDPSCPVRHVRMPEQDGQWGPEWDAYDKTCEQERWSALKPTRLDAIRPQPDTQKCGKPDCLRQTTSAYCCAPCREAAEGKYEIHAHSEGCDTRAEGRKP